MHRSFRRHPRSQTSWNKVAGWYDQLVGEKGSDYHQNVIIPQLIDLIKPQKGEKIIDIGCGQGVFCRRLAEKGIVVTGIDASPRLIDIAKKHSNNQAIKFQVADAADLKNISNAAFDAAISILALQNMEPLEKVIAEIARVVKPGGRFFLVLNHPCFRIPRQSGWGFDEKRKLQYRRIDSYLSEQKIPIKMHPGAKPDVYTWSFHRPLSAYFKVLTDNHLVVNQLEEWTSHRTSLPGKSKKAEDRARDEIPLFIAIAAIRLRVEVQPF
ncbi:MAG: class I SAM-dependent methyltransferase [Candidatus Margulisbacteria bacterium]|nr:class I SAM-dependent methyltransferase [Candidatus Margulisiibacteriota bacterium]